MFLSPLTSVSGEMFLLGRLFGFAVSEAQSSMRYWLRDITPKSWGWKRSGVTGALASRY